MTGKSLRNVAFFVALHTRLYSSPVAQNDYENARKNAVNYQAILWLLFMCLLLVLFVAPRRLDWGQPR
jgi:hypothetical protein